MSSRNHLLPLLLFLSLSLAGPSALANQVVGQTEGQFSVSPSGAATYNVPIEVPLNTGGVRPSLGVSYSSEGGHGLVGFGWSLSGLSVISRCPTSPDRDGKVDGVDFDDNDKFCMDGERLVNIGGNKYRTEIDNFSYIEGGESGFTVTSPEGLILKYGVSSNSRVQANGRAEVMIWALERAQDSFGNHYTVQYDNYGFSRGEYYPTKIILRNASNVGLGEVAFHYEDRADVTVGYTGGGENDSLHEAH